MKFFGHWINRDAEEALADARIASLQLGAKIFTELNKPSLGLTESLILTPAEFQALRMFLMEERPNQRLDVVWSYEQPHEQYYVKLDWDIGEIHPA